MTDHDPNRYDAIVVGARCAGSPTAMLLARAGLRVLLLDRARFPSDTVSTHLVHAPGVAALDRWGLLDRLIATGCPPITTYEFDFGALTLAGTPAPAGRTAVAYCPRRAVLDALLVEAASEAGAEVREGFTVDEVLLDDGRVVGVRGHEGDGSAVTERARVVVGADGVHSRVAAAVGAEASQEGPALAVAYYSYWSGIPVETASWMLRPARGYGAFPTNDGLTMLLAAWPIAELPAVRADRERSYERAVQAVFRDRLADARREERVLGAATPSRLRTPFGPGWALVGDAGYVKDPVTAQGISDAFQDAEQCAAALTDALTGRRSFDDAMADHRMRRDARIGPIFDFTTGMASLEPPPAELQQLLMAIVGNQPAMDELASVFAGTLSPADFFAPAHVGELIGTPS